MKTKIGSGLFPWIPNEGDVKNKRICLDEWLLKLEVNDDEHFSQYVDDLIDYYEIQRGDVVELKMFNVNYTNSDNLSFIENISKKAKQRGVNFVVKFKAKNSTLKKEEIDQLIDFEDEIGKDNSILMIADEGYDEYSLMELLVADEKIRCFVDDLKRRNLSPFENYLMIYDFLTQRVYKDVEDKSKSTHKPRDIISVLNGDYIVCVGYAVVMKRLCKEMGIQCLNQFSVVTEKDNTTGRHENNSIYLVDEKYGINGWYYTDACWDSVKEGQEGEKTYNYCLVPLTDKDKMINAQIEIENVCATCALYQDESIQKLCSPEIQLKIKFDSQNRALDMIYDDSYRDKVYDYVIGLLKSHNIPTNVYLYDIPEHCSINNILASAFLGDKDIAEMIVDSMTNIVKNGELLDEKKQDKKVILDIYYYLNQKRDILLNFSKENGLGDEKLEKSDIPKIHGEYHTIKRELEYREYYQIRQQERDTSVPINVEAFYNALRVVYQNEGVPEEEVERKVAESVYRTMIKAGETYFDDATNCFVDALKQYKELEKPTDELQ